MDKRLTFAAAVAFILAAAPALAQLPTARAASSITGTVGAATDAQLPSAPAPSTAPLPKTALPPASAATAPAANPPTTNTTTNTTAAGAADASASGANVSVTTGMDVKDSTGATIGKVTEVKAGADGKQTATIKMGAEVFALDTTSLAVVGGAATVNASQAEIKTMLKKK